jgi:hypothetical protein
MSQKGFNWFFNGRTYDIIHDMFLPIAAGAALHFQNEANCMPPKLDDAAKAQKPGVASQPSMRRFLIAKPPVVPAFEESKKRGRPPKKQKPGPKKPDINSGSLASTLPKSFTQPVLSSMFRPQINTDSESDSSQPECEFFTPVLYLLHFMIFFVCSHGQTCW